jgi:hypothetical protein
MVVVFQLRAAGNLHAFRIAFNVVLPGIKRFFDRLLLFPFSAFRMPTLFRDFQHASFLHRWWLPARRGESWQPRDVNIQV